MLRWPSGSLEALWAAEADAVDALMREPGEGRKELDARLVKSCRRVCSLEGKIFPMQPRTKSGALAQFEESFAGAIRAAAKAIEELEA